MKEAGDPETVDRLAYEMGIDRVLAELLVHRGITTFEESRAFFKPSLSELHDPFLMKDMNAAVERLHKAIQNREKILVYGDYDVDGTTAVALVYSFLQRLTTALDFYVPDRNEEGSGVSQKCLDWAVANGFSLMIILDCGIKASEKLAFARQNGLDAIICDHHLPEDSIPEVTAVLDPKLEDCGYPFDDLSGCGLGFKLVQGYSIRYGIPFEEITPLLDLVVVSIAADLVLITGENRILAHYGLKQLNDSPRKGLESIISLVGLDSTHIGIDDIVFKIGPRINAAGRMESGRIAVELLTAQDDETAFRIGNEINQYNNDRKNIDRKVTQEAMQMVASRQMIQGMDIQLKNTTIVYNPEWHKGVVGIVASRLVENFYKPAIVFTKTNPEDHPEDRGEQLITGSARSVQGFELYSAVQSCADLLVDFGGHPCAVGLTMKEANLPEFCRRMEAFAEGSEMPQQKVATVEIDSKLNFIQMTPKFLRILKMFQPFGPGNPAPVFLTENVYDNGSIRKVGAEGGHLKLELLQETFAYGTKSAIAFNMPELYDYIREGNPIDICYCIFENIYRGNASTQLRIKDIRERDEKI